MEEQEKNKNLDSLLPGEDEFYQRLVARHRRGKIGQAFYYFAILVALLALITLFANIINEAFGTVAIENSVDPLTVTNGRPVSELTTGELATIIQVNAERRLRVLVRDYLSVVPDSEFTTTPLSQVLAGRTFPAQIGERVVGDLTPSELTSLLILNLSRDDMEAIFWREVIQQEIVGSWSLLETIFQYDAIVAERDVEFPDATLQPRSWVNHDFLTSPMSSTPALAGIRTALLGSLYLIIIVIIVALPIGVGAAIYLEEYATDTWFNRIIETNIRNLAGVPSIIYGMLGLAVFVRVLGDITSGAAFGMAGGTGRTILSAGFTLALLVLPIIVINAQEALRAVPSTIREASFGLGATKWQTIARQVLPAALPGVLTGTILAVSRAIGETAPLIVVGAATFLDVDPSGPFSSFTALPIQIFQWSTRPQDQFRDIAAAAIIVLLVMLLTLNAGAILLRQRYSKRY